MNFFQSEIISHSHYRLDESLRMIKLCLIQLDEAELWWKANAESNSIANQMLHLSGNIGQYILSSLGNQPDIRNRDLEFETSEGYSKTQLIDILTKIINSAKQIIAETSEEDWLRVRKVQGFSFSGIGIVIHAVEHLSYHTGQIALLTKLLKNKPLGFYAEMDLNVKND